MRVTVPQRAIVPDEVVPGTLAAAEAGTADDPDVVDHFDASDEAPRGPTAAQLRRFIKSRPYVPMHELRRRFELNGEMDDVYAIEAPEGQHVYVGLPERESRFIADLARDGDIGLELSQDPNAPIVIGVYAMRPVARG
jgi:hypothetical protein